jgi:hypothetical protein
VSETIYLLALRTAEDARSGHTVASPPLNVLVTMLSAPLPPPLPPDDDDAPPLPPLLLLAAELLDCEELEEVLLDPRLLADASLALLLPDALLDPELDWAAARSAGARRKKGVKRMVGRIEDAVSVTRLAVPGRRKDAGNGWQEAW